MINQIITKFFEKLLPVISSHDVDDGDGLEQVVLKSNQAKRREEAEHHGWKQIHKDIQRKAHPGFEIEWREKEVKEREIRSEASPAGGQSAAD